MSTEKAAVKKQPIGIMPRRLHDAGRINNIYDAIGRYIKEEKQIPTEWTKELLDLSKSTFTK